MQSLTFKYTVIGFETELQFLEKLLAISQTEREAIPDVSPILVSAQKKEEALDLIADLHGKIKKLGDDSLAATIADKEALTVEKDLRDLRKLLLSNTNHFQGFEKKRRLEKKFRTHMHEPDVTIKEAAYKKIIANFKDECEKLLAEINNPKSRIGGLPNELLAEIVSHLDLIDTANFAGISHLHRDIVSDRSTWESPSQAHKLATAGVKYSPTFLSDLRKSRLKAYHENFKNIVAKLDDLTFNEHDPKLRPTSFLIIQRYEKDHNNVFDLLKKPGDELYRVCNIMNLTLPTTKANYQRRGVWLTKKVIPLVFQFSCDEGKLKALVESGDINGLLENLLAIRTDIAPLSRTLAQTRRDKDDINEIIALKVKKTADKYVITIVLPDSFQKVEFSPRAQAQAAPLAKK